jgi:hypothetical protein
MTRTIRLNSKLVKSKVLARVDMTPPQTNNAVGIFKMVTVNDGDPGMCLFIVDRSS